ncbi:unnamed protein product [Closterium sp. NIES-53]
MSAFGQEKSGKKAEEKGKQPTPRKRVSTVKKDADVASGRTDPGLTNDGTIGGKEDPGRGSVSLAVPSAEREGSATGGNHGDAPRAEHAATQESKAEASQHGLTLLQPTVVEISAAVVDKAKAGEHDLMEDLQHSIADVGGSPPSGGRGRRRQRKSDGEEEYDTAAPGKQVARRRVMYCARRADPQRGEHPAEGGVRKQRGGRGRNGAKKTLMMRRRRMRGMRGMRRRRLMRRRMRMKRRMKRMRMRRTRMLGRKKKMRMMTRRTKRRRRRTRRGATSRG